VQYLFSPTAPSISTWSLPCAFPQEPDQLPRDPARISRNDEGAELELLDLAIRLSVLLSCSALILPPRRLRRPPQPHAEHGPRPLPQVGSSVTFYPPDFSCLVTALRRIEWTLCASPVFFFISSVCATCLWIFLTLADSMFLHKLLAKGRSASNSVWSVLGPPPPPPGRTLRPTSRFGLLKSSFLHGIWVIP